MSSYQKHSISTKISLLSKHRNALMGIAILWVMLYHLYDYTDALPSLVRGIIGIGYGGVDMFLFLSGFGLYYSLSKKNSSLSAY